MPPLSDSALTRNVLSSSVEEPGYRNKPSAVTPAQLTYEMLDQINDYASSVSSVDDQLGLNFYASSAGASAIRDKMSGKPVNDPKGLVKQGVEGLTRVTSMRLPQNVVLYRGVAVPKDSQLANLKPGDKLTDPSFMSTSLKETTAHQFMKVQNGSARTEPILFEIESTGLSGAPFYAISGDGLISSSLLNTTYGEREAEVLLGANNELTVASVETKTRYDHAAKKNVTYSIVRLRASTGVDGAATSAAPVSVVENSTGAQTSVQPLATPAPPAAPTFSKFPAATFATSARRKKSSGS